MTLYFEHGKLPQAEGTTPKVATQSVHFAVVDEILYFTDSKCGNRKRVVPQQLQQQILQEGYGGLTG